MLVFLSYLLSLLRHAHRQYCVATTVVQQMIYSPQLQYPLETKKWHQNQRVRFRGENSASRRRDSIPELSMSEMKEQTRFSLNGSTGKTL